MKNARALSEFKAHLSILALVIAASGMSAAQATELSATDTSVPHAEQVFIATCCDWGGDRPK